MSNSLGTKSRQTAVVKPLNPKQKTKSRPAPAEPASDKPLETVKFKSPTRGYNRKNNVKCRYIVIKTQMFLLKESYSLSAKVNNGKSPTKSSPRKKSIPAEDPVEPKQRGRILSIINNWKSRASQEPESKSDPVLEEDVYGGLDASLTVLIHGLESDWIEEEMRRIDPDAYPESERPPDPLEQEAALGAALEEQAAAARAAQGGLHDDNA